MFQAACNVLHEYRIDIAISKGPEGRPACRDIEPLEVIGCLNGGVFVLRVRPTVRKEEYVGAEVSVFAWIAFQDFGCTLECLGAFGKSAAPAKSRDLVDVDVTLAFSFAYCVGTVTKRHDADLEVRLGSFSKDLHLSNHRAQAFID